MLNIERDTQKSRTLCTVILVATFIVLGLLVTLASLFIPYDLPDYTNVDSKSSIKNPPFIYDLIVTSVYRPMYGAVLASTLTSLALSGAMKNINSFHFVLADARTYNMSLVYNLRHMPGVQFHLVTEKVQHESHSTKWTQHVALQAPDKVQKSDYPSIIIEDDTWFVDDFPTRLAEVMRSAQRQSWKKPYFVTLYAIDADNIGETEKVRARDAAQQQQAPQAHFTAKRRKFGCGTQAAFYSTGDLRRQLAKFYKTQMDVPGLGDMPVLEFLRQHKINQYYPSTSLVQHTGSISALFNDGGKPTNHRFHRAPTFPYFEKYVTDDPLDMWCYVPTNRSKA